MSTTRSRPAMPVAPKSRVAALDGLRGAAALVVLLHHSLLTIPFFNDEHHGVNATPLHLLWAGREAVYIFFVLSGLVLVGPALERGINARSYYPSRLLRLYMPVLGAVALGWIVTTAVPRNFEPGQSGWMRLHQFEVTPWTYARDILLLAGTSNLNTPLWSLQWEVIFSLLLPVYVIVARRFQKHWLLLTVASIATSTVGAGLHLESVKYLSMFLIGGMIATQLPLLRTKIRQASAWASIIVLITALLSISSVYWVGGVLVNGAGTLTLPLVLVGAAGVVILCSAWQPLQSLLSRRGFQWAGRVSFSLYLTHELIVVSTAQILPSTLTWLTPFVAIPLSLAFAVLFFRFVEAPAHQLSKRVAKALSDSHRCDRPFVVRDS